MTATTSAEPIRQLLEELGPAPDFSDAPVVVFWETTRACALKCVHCRATAQPHRHPLELDSEEGYRLLDDLASFKRPPVVILTGGDPYMRQDIFDLLAYGMSLGLRISLSPSVTKLVKRETLQRFKGMGLSRLSFSLDGASAQLHDAFRGVRGSFDQAIARIKDALDTGLSLQIITTVSRHNLDDGPRIAELFSRFPRVVLWNLFFLVPVGRAQQSNVISAEDYERVFGWIHDLGSSPPFGVKTTMGQHYRRVAIQKAIGETDKLPEVWSRVSRSSTNDGKGVCFISHRGEVFPSGFYPFRVATYGSARW